MYSVIIGIALIVKVLLLIIHITTENPTILKIVSSHWIDLIIQIFFVVVAIRLKAPYKKLSGFALVSLFVVIAGNLIMIFPELSIKSEGYYLFLNIEALEVIVFALSIGYRNNFLKKERDRAIESYVDNLRKSEQLKDEINKEFEIKVADRTKQIQEMNDLLKFHNIELRTEVKVATEARVFQKNMSFIEFQKIFTDDSACYVHLANLKWKDKENIKCKKCSYDKLTELENYAYRCGKCGFVESVTNGTLFHKVRLPIQKAFYITYLTSIAGEAVNVSQTSKKIDLRQATVWAFKQKIIELMTANKTKRKHKDGWTHIIEYSIK